MSRKLVWLKVTAALAVLALGGWFAVPDARAGGKDVDPLVGRYDCEGVSGSGAPYSGKTVIVKKGETYLVSWEVRGEKYSGVGIRQGDTLSVAWKYRGDDYRLTVYRVEKRDDALRLVGRWCYVPDGTRLRKETLKYTGK
jgi:hypothetical protein